MYFNITEKQNNNCNIWFSDGNNICRFITIGSWIREVTILDGFEFVNEPGHMCHANETDKIILGELKSLNDIETWKWMVENGVDIHVLDEYALVISSCRGDFEAVKFLVENGADIHVNCDEPLRLANAGDHPEIIKYLIENGANDKILLYV